MTLKDTTYTITVDPWLGQVHLTFSHGSYGLRIHPVDRRPEGRPADYMLGDTVAGEPLDPACDVDEYTFTLNTTTTLRVFWEGRQPTGQSAIGLLIKEADGTIPWSSFNPNQEVTLPPGRYRMSVKNGFFDYDVAPLTMRYRFAISRN